MVKKNEIDVNDVTEAARTAPKTRARSKAKTNSKDAASAASAESVVSAEAGSPKRSRKDDAADKPAKSPRGKKAESAAAEAPSAPLAPSATSLIFQAPDLPTPVIDPKRGKIIDAPEDGESHLRRRSRRRAGDDIKTDGLPENVVVKVRTPREPKAPSNEPQRVKGSTRLEAKKQRRRDGRDAGRRRSVITESEFLARREAVDRTMVVRSKDGKIQLGVLEDKVLVEHYVAKSSEASLIGNVYLGKVQNVLPSMEAAFVDIGRGRNAVLYSGEVDWELAETGNQPKRIELALKSGDTVLVQVT